MKKGDRVERYVITGASRGIGRALAVRLAHKDRVLVIQGRSRDALNETRDAIKAKGGRVEPLIAELDTDQGLDTLVAALTGDRVDALINNAGVSHVAPIEELTIEQWQETLAVNVTAPFVLIQKLLPRMNRGATIVNVLSVANKVSFPSWTVYTMSKAALEGFSRVLREELRPRGIRVIDVYPAATATDLWDSVPGDWPKEGMLAPEQVAQAVAFALERPAEVLVDSISVGSLGGNL